MVSLFDPDVLFDVVLLFWESTTSRLLLLVASSSKTTFVLFELVNSLSHLVCVSTVSKSEETGLLEPVKKTEPIVINNTKTAAALIIRIQIGKAVLGCSVCNAILF